MTDAAPALPVLLSLTTPPQHVVDSLDAAFEVHWADTLPDLEAWVTREGARVTHVLTSGGDGISNAMIEALPNLKIISTIAVGYDSIDANFAASRGIVVTHTPDVLNAEVATTTLLLLLACYREFRSAEQYARSGQWERDGDAPYSRTVDNRTIGIVGLGRIGQAIADKLAPFNPTILYTTRTPKDVPYTHVPDVVELARRCDALICITPGGAATQHIINRDVMRALGPEGVLVNVARGSCVDEAALCAALEAGELGMAGLDVFEAEPHISPALCDSERTVVLPHIGSATVETRNAMAELAVENLLLHARGEALKTPVPESAALL